MEIYNEEFKISDYDIIGFDLDNTLARYRLRNMVKLEYTIMANYLMNQKAYPKTYLQKPFDFYTDFMIKGLFLDLEKGNLLKLDADAKIIKCFHGIHPLDQAQIIDLYGPNCHWHLTDLYVTDALSCWNGPLTTKVRALLDYFDIPVSLIFARLITTIDEYHSEGGSRKYSKAEVWRDICNSLTYMFNYEHFTAEKGEFFPELKKSPESYYYPCSEKVKAWLRELRTKNKLMVLISGSDCDFVSHTALNTFGDNWTELFDMVVCFAKKPGFFSGENRPFLNRELASRTGNDPTEVPSSELRKGGVYRMGNWDGLLEFAQRETGIANPRALYFGDNMVQDVVMPKRCAGIDVVAIVEELAGESHEDRNIILSSAWGSYMGANKPGELPSLWAAWLREYSCLAISSIDVLADFPIDHVFVKKDKNADDAS